MRRGLFEKGGIGDCHAAPLSRIIHGYNGDAVKGGPEVFGVSFEHFRLEELFHGAGEDTFQEREKSGLPRRRQEALQVSVDEP